MSWLEAIPSLLTATLWLLIPGVLTGYAFGLRGIAAWAAAPAVSTASVAIAAIVADKLALPWSPTTAGALTIVPAIVILLVRLLRRHPFTAAVPSDPLRVRLAGLFGLVPAVLIGLAIIVRGFRSPANLSQTYDAVFHYNAIRWIVSTGNASSLKLGGIAPEDSGSFYPGAWHDLASLVTLTNGSLTVAANATAGMIAVIVWPLACMFLVRQILGRSAGAQAITGTVAVGFTAFPWGLLQFGVLWPNALGFALVPIGLGAGLSILGMAKQDSLTPSRAWLILISTVLATGIAQPNTTFSLFALLLLPALVALGSWFIRRVREGRAVRGTLVVSGTLIAAILGWIFVHSLQMVTEVKDFHWAPFTSVPAAVGEVVLNATNGRPPLWLLSAAVIAGVVFAFRDRLTAWVPFAHLGIAAMFVMCAAVQTDTTHIFTGFWYNDSYRLAATLPVTGVVLAVSGVLRTGQELAARLSDSPKLTGLTARIRPTYALTGALATLLLLVTLTGYRHDSVLALQQAYHSEDGLEATLVYSGEHEFYEKVDEIVPDGAVVANNPWDGSAMLWALTGTRVLFPQLNQKTWNDGQKYLAEHLNEVATNEKACRLANLFHVEYVITGSFNFWLGDNRITNYPGLTGLSGHRGFEQVSAQGPLKLYKITGCENPRAASSPTAGR